MDEEYRPVPREALEETVERALEKARLLLPRKREPGVFNPYRSAASVVVEHLERCRIVCVRKPTPPMHGSPQGPVGEDEGQARD